jgi:hypothetical protein
LPPIEQGGEFDSLDSAGDSETEEQPVEMSLHGSARHLELGGNLGIVTALQEQFDNLLLTRAQPNGLLRHRYPHGFWICLRSETFAQLGGFHNL